MAGEAAVADLRRYSVYDLLVSGSRFTDDYDEAAAIEHYLELHPGADRQAVTVELRNAVVAKG